MQHEVLYRPVSTLAKIQLNPGESVLAEPGAMIGMSTNVQMQTGLPSGGGGGGGGLLGKLAGAASRLLTGESFFQNTFTAQGGPGEVLLAHTLPGDMTVIQIPSAGLKVQSTSFVASSVGCRLEADFGGARTFFGGEGLFVINAQASGSDDWILIGCFGGIHEMQCDGSLVIDTGHLVAWDNTLGFNVTKASGGWISSFLSGEGLVCQFNGQGRIWIQTRQPREYGTMIGQLLPPRTN